jgi:hypothetical protein
MENHYMNWDLDRIEKEGYIPIGFPGLFNVGFPIQELGDKFQIEKIAEDAIKNSNLVGLPYQRGAIYTASSDDRWGQRILRRAIPTKEKLHLIIVVPLTKIL